MFDAGKEGEEGGEEGGGGEEEEEGEEPALRAVEVQVCLRAKGKFISITHVTLLLSGLTVRPNGLRDNFGRRRCLSCGCHLEEKTWNSYQGQERSSHDNLNARENDPMIHGDRELK